jgi:hypothetical protein
MISMYSPAMSCLDQQVKYDVSTLYARYKSTTKTILKLLWNGFIAVVEEHVLFVSLSYSVVSLMTAFLSADWHTQHFQGSVQYSQ